MIISYGTKYGTPPKATKLYSALSIPNPYHIKNLSPLRGNHPAVKSWVMSKLAARKLADQMEADYIRFSSSGDPVILAVGCHGGRHRSVVIAEVVAERLGVHVAHRDLLRDERSPTR